MQCLKFTRIRFYLGLFSTNLVNLGDQVQTALVMLSRVGYIQFYVRNFLQVSSWYDFIEQNVCLFDNRELIMQRYCVCASCMAAFARQIDWTKIDELSVGPHIYVATGCSLWGKNPTRPKAILQV